MDDMNAFERQLGTVLGRMGGPEPQFDALEIARGASAPSTKWRFQSMFSATKFVLAGVVLALFGGLLLTGVLTQQPSEDAVPPAGASASASILAEPTEAAPSEAEPATTVEIDAGNTAPDLLPGVDLDIEEVEPGVYRVLSDGVGHDLPAVAPAWHTFGPDGELVVFGSSGSFGSSGGFGSFGNSGGFGSFGNDLTVPFMTSFFTVGTDRTFEFEDGDRSPTWFFDAAVASDGTLWAVLDAWEESRLGAFDGSSWTVLGRPAGTGFAGVEVGPDGTLWASRVAQDGRGPRVGRISDGEWSRLPESDDPALRSYYGAGPMRAGPDGTLWFANGGIGPIVPDIRGLLRFDGEEWHKVVPDVERPGAFVNQIGIGPDGTVWAYLIPYREMDKPRLARLGASGWDVFTPQDGVPVLHAYGNGFPTLTVDAAGTVWIAINNSFGASLDVPGHELDSVHRCPGVLSFDGSVWKRYLIDVCVNHIEVGPQGSIWASAPFSETPDTNPVVTSREPVLGPGGLYVIDPKAASVAK